MCGSGSASASTPLANEMMTAGGRLLSFQNCPICRKTVLVSVEGSPLMTTSASHTASWRLVTTLRGHRGVSRMLTQKPSLEGSGGE